MAVMKETHGGNESNGIVSHGSRPCPHLVLVCNYDTLTPPRHWRMKVKVEWKRWIKMGKFHKIIFFLSFIHI